jgi:hypothetical protein
MNRNGWSVLRVWHVDVLKNRRAVLDTILAALSGDMATKVIAPDLKFLPAVATAENDKGRHRPSSALRAPSPRERGEGR